MFYYNVFFKLPPGPLPLPILGNNLLFWTSAHIDDIMRKIAVKYGPIFTVYIGWTPQVIITDLTIGKTVFRQRNFNGRPILYSTHLFSNKKFSDIAMSDYDKRWVALRRIGHTAIVNYSSNERLAKIVCDCVDTTIRTIRQTEQLNAFYPNKYLFNMSINIMIDSLFGKLNTLTADEFSLTKLVVRDLALELGAKRILLDVSPIFSWIFPSMATKLTTTINKFNDMAYEKFMLHYNSHNDNNQLNQSDDEDLCDKLIATKRYGQLANREWSQYLSDKNLAQIVSNLFETGTNSFDDVMQWMLLLMTYYPSVQQMLRKDIDENIGHRLPRHEDKDRCHYVMAFIAETLRFRNTGVFGFYHKSMETSNIGNYIIPKDTFVIVYMGYIMRNNKDWENSDHFIPERFIDTKTGHYMTNRFPEYIPFGVGLRQCVAEKLSIAGIFLLVVRFIQSTKRLVLSDNNGIDGDPNNSEIYVPKPYKIVLETNL